MPTTRKLKRWRWSVQVLANPSTDIAGELIAGSADEALGVVARDQCCALPLPSFHYWHHGGHATARNARDEEVAIVVVAFGPVVKRDGERVDRRVRHDVERCDGVKPHPNGGVPGRCTLERGHDGPHTCERCDEPIPEGTPGPRRLAERFAFGGKAGR